MRLVAIAFVLAVSACGRGGDGGELAAGNSEVSSAQVDAALGPADQSSVEDAIADEEAQNGVTGNETAPANNSAAADDEDEQ